jgi:DUF1009 family protein
MSLALICGTGDLPRKVAEAQAEAPFICVLEGFAPEGLEADVTFRLETLGSLLVRLGHEGVTEVCFCGAIERPSFDPAKLDEHTAPLVPIYAERGILREVDGMASIDEVSGGIDAALKEAV